MLLRSLRSQRTIGVRLVGVHLSKATSLEEGWNLTIDRVIPQSRGGTDHLENLQLLCGACNSLKGDRPQEYLVARLAEIGV